jgi:crotonobetainyl-CoA:carnitine CoA-transferase CaiB-like acyl-CoA transferase
MVITTERFFRRMLQAIGRDDLLDDPRFATARGRAEHRDYLDAILMPWLLDRTRNEAFQQLQKYRVMCAPILTAEEILADPQLNEREYFVELDHPAAGKLPYPGAPFIMSETPFSYRFPAPLLGQHNEEIYCGELGLSKDELEKLKQQGAI